LRCRFRQKWQLISGSLELPNGGWPRSSLVELLVQQHGIGEMQLLKPVLAALSRQQRVAFVQPPYLPHTMAFKAWQLLDKNVLWLRPKTSADALWAAEQTLKNGSCGAVVLWQSNVRPESLRRLNLSFPKLEDLPSMDSLSHIQVALPFLPMPPVGSNAMT